MDSENIYKQEQINLTGVDTSEVVSLLKNYNEQFGMGKTLARIILSSLRSQQHEESNTSHSDTETSATNDQAAEQLLTFDDMKTQLSALLDTIGLEFQPIKANWVLVGSGEDHTGSEMRLNLKDGPRFVAYLQALSPEAITESQKEGLREIIVVLTNQFNSYNLDDSNDDRLLEFMGSVSVIIDEYKRLFHFNEGTEVFPGAIMVLETYLSYARKGYLREYRKVEALQLDRPFTGEGFILRWHTDATPGYLREKWDLVIDTLKTVFDNPKARELYDVARNNALQALESAIQEVSALPDTNNNKQKFLSILQGTQSRLSEF